MDDFDKVHGYICTRMLCSEDFLRAGGRMTTRARHAAWYLLRRVHGRTLAEIGTEYQTDHSSVRFGVRRFEETTTPDERDRLREAYKAFTGEGKHEAAEAV